MARLLWMPIESQIPYLQCIDSVALISVPLDPSIVFGTQHTYSTRSLELFANISAAD